MEKYYFTKWVKPEETVAFEEVISLNVDLALWEKLGLFIRPHNLESQVTDDNIEVQATMILTSDEQDQLADAINSFNENHELVERNKIRINRVNPNITWAQNLIATFGANNLFLDKSLPDLTALIATFDNLMRLCNAGAVEMAYIELLQIAPDATFSQAEKDEFVKRFEVYLGKALTDAIKAQLGG